MGFVPYAKHQNPIWDIVSAISQKLLKICTKNKEKLEMQKENKTAKSFLNFLMFKNIRKLQEKEKLFKQQQKEKTKHDPYKQL